MSREVTFEKVVSDVIFDILTDERPLHRKIILARIQERGINVKGKNKKVQGRNRGRRSDWRKAYVRLKPGHDIDFVGPVE